MRYKLIICLFVLSLFILPFSASSPFQDVLEDHFAYESIANLSEKGIVKGFTDGTFKPDKEITRAEMSVMLSKAIQYMEQNNTQINIDYEDKGSIDERVVAVIAKSLPSVVQVTGDGYLGAGFIIEGNYIITANHVIENMTNITVTLSSGNQYPATLAKTSPEYDLAMLKINESIPLSYLELETQMNVGQTVLAIGHPKNEANSITKGIISNLNRQGIIQTDAAINSGNSGGVLLDLNGKVLGVVISKYTGADVDNMAFAIKSDIVDYFIKYY